MRLYRNGAQVGTAAIGSPIRTGNQPLRVGGNAVWNEWFAGRIDEVRIYNRALAVAEIQADMNRPVSNGSTAALRRGGTARGGRNAKARRNLARARRRSSLRRERARRDLPLRRHVRGRN